MTACRQPGCAGRIVDGYCDVCGSPAGAAPFVPAGSAASAVSPAPAVEAGLRPVGWGSGVPLRPNNPVILACTQQGCAGTIVDGYCDVCGSPAGAVLFVPAAASAASPAPADEPGLMAVPASTPPAPAPVNDTILDLPWSTKTTDWIDIEESREVEATLRRLSRRLPILWRATLRRLSGRLPIWWKAIPGRLSRRLPIWWRATLRRLSGRLLMWRWPIARLPVHPMIVMAKCT
jgi:hypothetical protein